MNNFETFSQLHQQQTPLILPNAWNVKSAQLIEQQGYKAIGTSSGAIANALGYDDGEKISFNELLYIVKRIKACTHIPLTVDLERGYTDNVQELTEHIDRLLDAGVVGINIEDAQGEDIYLRKLEAINNHLQKTGRQLFVNARTDVFLQQLPSPLDLTIKRAKRYQAAGAMGLFVTGLADPAVIREIAAAVELPLNIVGTAKLSSFKELAAAGVRRISMAVFLYRATYNGLEQLLKQIERQESMERLF